MANEPGRDNAGALSAFRHLVRLVGRTADRTAQDRAIYSHSHLGLCGACRDSRKRRSCRPGTGEPVTGDADVIYRVGFSNLLCDGLPHRGGIHLYLYDGWDAAVAHQYVLERRHADTKASKGILLTSRKPITGINPRELLRAAGGNRSGSVRRPIERPIMMHDDDAIRREVDIELETVRAGGHPYVKRRYGVLRAKVAAAPMREHLRAGAKKRHNAQC